MDGSPHMGDIDTWESFVRLKGAVGEAKEARMRRKSSAPLIEPATEMAENATRITIKASAEGRKTVKKVKLPASASFDEFMQKLAAKFTTRLFEHWGILHSTYACGWSVQDTT